MKIDEEKYPYCALGHQYALDIVEGRIAASIYTIGACNRYLRDIERTDVDWYFSLDTAEKYLRVVQKFDHAIGTWETKNIEYEPWQCFNWMNIFGFRRKSTGFRRYRFVHLEIGRGNGKSPMASQCALFLLALDDPNGNEISTVATKKEQARIVLDSSRVMASKNKSFIQSTGVKVLAHTIVHPKSNSKMRALASDSSSLDGMNDILIVCDELHAMARETFNVVYSGTSKRKDSLMLCITTAGDNLDGVGYSQSTYARKVCLNEVDDDQFFANVYTLDKDDYDRWFDETIWIKANPNLGVSVDLESLVAKRDKALVTPSDIPNFKTKHLNIWLSEANAFFDLKKWDDCYQPGLKFEDFASQPCRVGIDLASHIDLTSTAYLFKKGDIYYIFERTFLPEATLKSANSTLYDEAVAKGFLIPTKGEAINNNFIREDIEEQAKKVRIIECGYDSWNATEMSQNLANKIEMIKVGMNVGNLSEPMKKLDAMIRKGEVRHCGSPLLRWCLGNVVAKEDHNSNVYPRKTHEKLKIDPVIAILIALALWLQGDSKESVYETRGIRSI